MPWHTKSQVLIPTDIFINRLAKNTPFLCFNIVLLHQGNSIHVRWKESLKAGSLWYLAKDKGCSLTDFLQWSCGGWGRGTYCTGMVQGSGRFCQQVPGMPSWPRGLMWGRSCGKVGGGKCTGNIMGKLGWICTLQWGQLGAGFACMNACQEDLAFLMSDFVSKNSISIMDSEQQQEHNLIYAQVLLKWFRENRSSLFCKAGIKALGADYTYLFEWPSVSSNFVGRR